MTTTNNIHVFNDVNVGSTKSTFQESINKFCRFCSNCKEEGHRMYKCPKIECRYCHTLGHIARICPNRTTLAISRSNKYWELRDKQRQCGTNLAINTTQQSQSLSIESVEQIKDLLSQIDVIVTNACDDCNKEHCKPFNRVCGVLWRRVSLLCSTKWHFVLGLVVILITLFTLGVFTKSFVIPESTKWLENDKLQTVNNSSAIWSFSFLALALIIAFIINKLGVLIFGRRFKRFGFYITQACFIASVLLIINKTHKINTVTLAKQYNVTDIVNNVTQHYNNSNVINNLQQENTKIIDYIKRIDRQLKQAELKELYNQQQHLQSKKSLINKGLSIGATVLGLYNMNPFAVMSGAAEVYDTFVTNDDAVKNRIEEIQQQMQEEIELDSLNKNSQDQLKPEPHIEEVLSHQQGDDLEDGVKGNKQNSLDKGILSKFASGAATALGAVTAWYKNTKDSNLTKHSPGSGTRQHFKQNPKSQDKQNFGFASVYSTDGRETGSDIVKQFSSSFNSYYTKPTKDFREIGTGYERSMLSVFRKYNGDEPVTNKRLTNWYYGVCAKDPQCLNYAKTGEMY